MHSVKYKTWNTIHDEYQPPHISVSECHLQGVYQKKQVHAPFPVRIALTVVIKILNNNIEYVGLTIIKPQSVTPFSRVKNSWPFQMGPIDFPEISVMNHHYSLHNSPEEGSSQRDLVQIERVKCMWCTMHNFGVTALWIYSCQSSVCCRILIF